VRLAVVAANDLWEGILRTAENLQSGTIVAGSSAKMPITEQARETGTAWERIPEPRPRVTLEVLTPAGHQETFYLGPHAPRLTPKEVDLLHKVWLDFSERLPKEELHHHDVVHFALDFLSRAAEGESGDGVLFQLRDHLHEIGSCRAPAEDRPMWFNSR
jgi:hypothetical protein